MWRGGRMLVADVVQMRNLHRIIMLVLLITALAIIWNLLGNR
jgi:hypothetical protein